MDNCKLTGRKQHKKHTAKFWRRCFSFIISLAMIAGMTPQEANAVTIGWGDGWIIIDGEYFYYGNSSDEYGAEGSLESKYGAWAENYQYEVAVNADDVIAICQNYSDRNVNTGVRNQIEWMRQTYFAATQGYVAQLDFMDALLISVLNHTDINTTLLSTSYSMGDINRIIAQQILEGKDGYTDIDTIAKETGLSVKDVEAILDKIASGSVTEDTISRGKNSSAHTNRGAYYRNNALKQEKVFTYLTSEVERITTDQDSLSVLYADFGGGYISHLISGYELDEYQVMLYERYLAKLLDSTIESQNPYSVYSYEIGESQAYTVAKKTRSALSGLLGYELGAYTEELSDELKVFLDEHLGNGVLSESEAREYLILSGTYEAGEHGIGEAAKQLSAGYKHLQGLNEVLDSSGKAFSAIEKLKKADDFIEYWATDYAQQEILLDRMVDTLSVSGADPELMVAARELQEEYSDKLSGTFESVYSALVDEGVSTIKSSFPPLTIAETCISLVGTLTGADKHVDALETGLAMQGICKQAIQDYEDAVLAVKNGDTSEEAISQVLTTFEMARQSLVSYYEAMVELAETDAEKQVYEVELQKLENSQFGYVVVLPFGGGGGGSR